MLRKYPGEQKTSQRKKRMKEYRREKGWEGKGSGEREVRMDESIGGRMNDTHSRCEILEGGESPFLGLALARSSLRARRLLRCLTFHRIRVSTFDIFAREFNFI